MKRLACQPDRLCQMSRVPLLVSALALSLFSSSCRRTRKDEHLNHAEAQKQADSMNARMPPSCAKWAVRDHPDGTSVVYLDESACQKVSPVNDGFKAMDKRRSQK